MSRLEGEPRRIVVTGMGAVTPLGNSVEEMWERSVAGESGISSVELPPTDVVVAGKIQNFEPKRVFEGPIDATIAGMREGRQGRWKGVERRVGTAAQFALVAAHQALVDAGVIGDGYQIDPHVIDPERIGSLIGTGIGGGEVVGEVQNSINAGEVARRFAVLRMLPERVASVISMIYGAQGPMWSVSNACATGGSAVSSAYDQIYLGRAEMMLTGAAEHGVHPLSAALFTERNVRPLSSETSPDRASKPFDADRDGFVLAEGAGVLVLEELGHARKRDAKIYAEIVGVGNTADAQHETAPSGIGAERAIREAFRWAYAHLGLLLEDGEDVYVNAHATSTKEGDPVEAEVIERSFPQAGTIFVHAPKSQIGHALGASGAIESVLTVKTLESGTVPPTVHLDSPISEVSGLSVTNEAQQVAVRFGVKNSFGFGGGNSVIVFQRYEGQREV